MIGKPGASRRVRLRHKHADGHWVWFELTNTNLLDDPEHGYVTAEMVDISEEMAATEALRAGELLLRRLTDGCLIRGAIMDALSARLARPEAGVCVLFIDLDKFKQVNDELGHGAGDDVLRQVGSTLRASTRDEDLVGRLGRDEFIVVIDGISSAAAAEAAVVRIREALSAPFELAGRSHVTQASVGCAWSCDPTPAEDLIARADVSMYQAKARPVLVGR